jgi:Zn-dependent protease
MDGIDLGMIRSGLMVFLLLVVSVALHEWGHAFVADLLGDDTPRSQGRVTLNPLVHIDLIGTIIFPLVMIFIFRGNFAPYGWGRPVLTNAANFKHRKAYDILATLAGSGANFVLAFLAVVVGAFVVPKQPDMAELLRLLISVNITLGVFNLLPIPPLDGGYILRQLVGMSEEMYLNIARWSFLVFFVALYLEPVRLALALVFNLSYMPFIYLCEWLNPNAAALLFQ